MPERHKPQQSPILVALAAGSLALGTGNLVRSVHSHPQHLAFFLLAAAISSTFALLVWALRAGTPAAAFAGGAICLLVSETTRRPGHSLFESALPPLATLFVLTFVATRLGRQRKQTLGLAESPQGRNAAQVIANLGAAGLIAAFATWHSGQPGWAITMPILAALAEATADTLASEIGQAFGGTPRLLTRLHPVPPGTDGAISLLGTVAGGTGAAIVTLVGVFAVRIDGRAALTVFLAAIAGLFFDSLLGATVERRGWLDNDHVNFFSTLFAALMALVLHRFF